MENRTLNAEQIAAKVVATAPATCVGSNLVVSLKDSFTGVQEVKICTATDVPFGILLPKYEGNNPQDEGFIEAAGFNKSSDYKGNAMGSVLVSGATDVVVDTGGVTAGKLVCLGDDGKVKNWRAGSGATIIGIALQTAAAGKKALIWFKPDILTINTMFVDYLNKNIDLQIGEYFTANLATALATALDDYNEAQFASQTLTDDGAITFAKRYNLCTLNKGSAINATLASPVESDNGKILVIQGLQAKSNIVTADDALAIDGLYKKFTATGSAANEKLVLIAMHTKWIAITVDGVLSNPA